jgi:steroid delta-isomerase-like uncharacterized protein
MSDQAAAQLMEAYFDALTARGDFAAYLADDVTFEVVGTPQAAQGRTAVRDAITYLHTQAFDATAKLKTVLAADGHAAVECDFIGTHTAEFLGVAPAGRPVNVPYAVVYDLSDTQIFAIRVYMSMEVLRQQLEAR